MGLSRVATPLGAKRHCKASAGRSPTTAKRRCPGVEGGSATHLNYRFEVVFNRGSRLNRSSSTKTPGNHHKCHRTLAGQRVTAELAHPMLMDPTGSSGLE